MFDIGIKEVVVIALLVIIIFGVRKFLKNKPKDSTNE
jgi:Sec-independent protein translocase protein TatA